MFIDIFFDRVNTNSDCAVSGLNHIAIKLNLTIICPFPSMEVVSW